MKKFLSILIVVAMVATLAVAVTSCGGTGAKYKVGIVQLVTHEALDAATEGFKQALIDKLGKGTVEFVYQNAAGDSAQCATIVNQFVSSKVDSVSKTSTVWLAETFQEHPTLLLLRNRLPW